MQGNPAYLQGLDKNEANYAPLTPLTFIERAAYVYPNKLSVVHGAQRFTWAETYARCRRLGSALARRGIGARLLITDREYAPIVEKALAIMGDAAPPVIDIDDPACQDGKLLGETTYEAFLETGDPGYAWQNPADEWDAIALNYTSGTTGDPKGVVYHHRGAHLNAVSNILNWGMPFHAVYLWTLPMFHCNGWCFPWTVAERAGVNGRDPRHRGHAYVRRADRLFDADQLARRTACRG